MFKLKERSIKTAVTLSLAAVIFSPHYSFAASQEDIDAQIQNQQKILDELNAKRSQVKNEKLLGEIDSLSAQIQELKNRKNYDAEGAIDALAGQINTLQQQIKEQNETQSKLMSVIERLETLSEQKSHITTYDSNPPAQSAGTSNMLVNPAPNQKVSYTQDAKNAQGNSTMVFHYQPNHIYKIYCRTGYLTDMEFHKGETIKFVGGGDTSAWALNTSTVDGVPHVYIKPVVETNTTNIIVTTNKRSYQLIVCTSDWYNPMVKWTYNEEDMQSALAQQKRDEDTITSTMSAHNVTDLNFNYEIRGSSDNKPDMVFDDGEKTIMKYNKKLPKKAPAVFFREKGHKGVSLMNFKMRDNCYILDRVVDEAELRFSNDEIVEIKAKK